MEKTKSFLALFFILLSLLLPTSCSEDVIIIAGEIYEPYNPTVIYTVNMLDSATLASSNDGPSQDLTVTVTGEITWNDFLYIREHLDSFEKANKKNRVTLDMSEAFGIDAFKECAFYYMSSIKSVKLPQGIKEIGKYVFYGCHHLESVTIPKSVRYIGTHAFPNNDEAIDIVFEGPAEIELGRDSFIFVKTNPTIPENVKIWTLDMDSSQYSLLSGTGDIEISTTLELPYDFSLPLRIVQHNDKERELFWDELQIGGQSFKALLCSSKEITDLKEFDMFFVGCFNQWEWDMDDDLMEAFFDSIEYKTDCDWYYTKDLEVFLTRDTTAADILEPELMDSIIMSFANYFFAVPKLQEV